MVEGRMWHPYREPEGGWSRFSQGFALGRYGRPLQGCLGTMPAGLVASGLVWAALAGLSEDGACAVVLLTFAGL